MFTRSKSRIFAILVVAVQLGAFTTAGIAVADPNIQQIQEGLVWTGYYEGPVDGSLGAGTQTAIKRFQHDIGKPETGSLDDPQAATLAQRAQILIQQTGYRPLLDARSGIRTGMPLGLVSQRRSVAGGSDYTSPDGKMQIGLRVFRAGADAAALFGELKGRLESSSTTTYSVGRSTWFVLAGQSDSRKYYLRYNTGGGLIAGFFSVHDNSLPHETSGAYVAAVTMMSLTMQTFAADLVKEQIPALTDVGQLEPAALSAAGSDQAQASPAPPLQPAPSANDATVHALQKQIAELEAKQRQLERQLAAKTTDAPLAKPATTAKADTPPIPAQQKKRETTANTTGTSGTPTKPASSGLDADYVTMAVLALLTFALLVLFRRRRPSPAAPIPGASASPAPAAAPAASDAHLAAQDVAPPLQQRPDTPVAAATPAPVATPAPAAAASTNGSGLNIVLVGGGMVLLVFLLAFAVNKIASLTGFS